MFSSFWPCFPLLLARLKNSLAVLLLALGATAAYAHSGLSWVQEHISPPVRHAGFPVTLQFSPAGQPGVAAPSPNHRIQRVFVWRRVSPAAVVRSRLCAGSRCVTLFSDRLETVDFLGLPANLPLVLHNEVLGEGPLPQPVSIKATVIVWYQ